MMNDETKRDDRTSLTTEAIGTIGQTRGRCQDQPQGPCRSPTVTLLPAV